MKSQMSSWRTFPVWRYHPVQPVWFRWKNDLRRKHLVGLHPLGDIELASKKGKFVQMSKVSCVIALLLLTTRWVALRCWQCIMHPPPPNWEWEWWFFRFAHPPLIPQFLRKSLYRIRLFNLVQGISNMSTKQAISTMVKFPVEFKFVHEKLLPVYAGYFGKFFKIKKYPNRRNKSR